MRVDMHTFVPMHPNEQLMNAHAADKHVKREDIKAGPV
jgi:hypothetical protein